MALNYPEHYYFTAEREWIDFRSEEIARIGMTELAIRELQPIRSIEIHTVGQTLTKNQVFGRIKNDTVLCKLIMPFDGIIVEANDSYLNDPELVNGPYSYNDWLVTVRLTGPVDKTGLFPFAAYKTYKTDRIFQLITYLLPRKPEQ